MKMRITGAILFLTICLNAGEVVDRIVAVVNNTPVLLSDWDAALRCEALLAGRSPESFSESEQKAVFDRLVDQQLIREQMRGYSSTPVEDADLQKGISEIRKQIAGNATDDQWREKLASSGVTEQLLRDRIRTQFEIERFVEARFRPGLKIDDRAVAKYYREDFLPQLRQAGEKDVPLVEVADRIREILVQQRIDEMLTSWLQALHEEAEIKVSGASSQSRPAEVSPAK